MAATKTAEATAEIQIEALVSETIKIPILGTTPLICNRMSEKGKREMLARMQGEKLPKKPKDPEAEFLAASYRFTPGGSRYGTPSVAFKSATVSAARLYGNNVTMVALRQCLFFGGEMGLEGQLLVELEHDGEPIMREDVVKLKRGRTDLRYRPGFWPWAAVLSVTYIKAQLTRSSVLSLVDTGGMTVGVGEWRPERKGDFGTYKINTDKEIEVVE